MRARMHACNHTFLIRLSNFPPDCKFAIHLFFFPHFLHTRLSRDRYDLTSDLSWLHTQVNRSEYTGALEQHMLHSQYPDKSTGLTPTATPGSIQNSTL